MKKNIIFVMLMVALSVCFPAFSQENITISTYYPSPFGVYETLRLFPTTQPGAIPCEEGTMYFDINTQQVMICAQNAAGNPVWQGVGLWSRNGNNIFLADINWNAGVGTLNPQAKLDVNGGIRVGDATACSPANSGTIRYHNNMLEYCNGTNWVSALPPLAIGSGNVFNGGLIPFPNYPDGSTAQLNECEWIVAPNSDICTNTGGSCSGAQETDHLVCSATVIGGRIQVHAYTQEHGDPPIHPYQVRYLIVCRK